MRGSSPSPCKLPDAGMNDAFESIIAPVPGPGTRRALALLRAHESRNVTFLSDEFPIVWESAEGACVTDVDGNRYIDLTSAFGVASVGHSNPRVAAAIAAQARTFMHGMGDVHPSRVRARLLERLTHRLPLELSKMFLATTGSEAVEAALKTAALATGKSAFAAYRGAYHGLSHGALNVCGIEKFRTPFHDTLDRRTLFLDFPFDGRDDVGDALARTRDALAARNDLAAVLVEPIQGRAGCVLPPDGYLRGLQPLCNELGILLIFDEIYTGFGRTGTWFAFERDGVTPDILCVGKAMGGGFPISAAIARAEVMDAWPRSTGEALHTSTYLGNPMGCAAALAVIGELEQYELPARASTLGTTFASRFASLLGHAVVRSVRGRGLFWGIELESGAAAARAVTLALQRGVILLQSGTQGDVLTIAPPLVISEAQLHRAIDSLEDVLAAL